MFWLRSVSLSLWDYRLIAINALIYDLIAAEIVHAATAVTEFDKSAARMQTMRTATPKTVTAAANGLWQRRDALEMSTAMNNNKTAELTFFGTKVSVDESDSVESGINNNNNNNNNNDIKSYNNTSGRNNRINNPQTSIADGEVIASTITAVATAASPSDLSTASSNRRNENMNNNNNNNISIMATVNERVDNFRNGKKQTNRQIEAKVGRTTAAASIANVAGTTTSIATKTTTIQGRTIAAKVITAIKSPAMDFLTTTATATKLKLETHEAAKAKSAESATAATSEASVAALKWVTALATIPKTTTTKATHATTRWPTLPGHDLLSPTNGLPNCRGILEFALDIGECFTKTNNNHTRTTTTTTVTTTMATAESTFAQSSTATTTITTLSTSPSSSISTSTSTLSPVATLSTAKLQPETPATTTTHVTAKLAGVKLSPSKASNNHTKNTAYTYLTAKNTVIATPMKSSAIKRSDYPVPAVPWISTTTATATKNTMRILRNAATATTKLTTALQSQWQRILSRRKRYLAFPEGASFTVSLCITVGIVGNPTYSYMSFGLNWGLAYDLPNATWVLNQLHGLYRRPLPMAVHHRRSKRAIYERIGEAVDNMGYNGRECVLRALCESRQYFTNHKMGMIGEVLRVIFSLPKQRLFTRELHENSDIAVYDHAYRQARSLDCAGQFDCSFSLLELAFGRYSKPLAEFYDGMNM